jgi:hypothetical protein
MRVAATLLERVDMNLHAACVRLREGTLRGGSVGRSLVPPAQADLARRGVVDAERWGRIFV